MSLTYEQRKYMRAHHIPETEELIDFPVSQAWARYYAEPEVGLIDKQTFDTERLERKIETLENKIADLERRRVNYVLPVKEIVKHDKELVTKTKGSSLKIEK